MVKMVNLVQVIQFDCTLCPLWIFLGKLGGAGASSMILLS